MGTCRMNCIAPLQVIQKGKYFDKSGHINDLHIFFQAVSINLVQVLHV
jgi:hypothetical protein